MDELVKRIAAATGLDEPTARQAVGMILGFLKAHAPEGPVGDLIRAIPGADAAVTQHGTPAPGGEATGGGGLMGLAGKLTGAGLDMGQMQGVGREIFQYAKHKVGEERLGEIAAGVPGLAGML